MNTQEKMLLVGGDIATPDAITYCKELGVYTIMTNDIPYENNPYKQMADEAWDIPVEELDLLEAKCREACVTGVFAGVKEHNLDMTKALAERLGLPFYASDEAWRCARDKIRFKEHCMAVGLEVPKQFFLEKPFTDEMLTCISYPVMVKPADSSGSRGITVCRNEEELRVAFDKAIDFSQTGRVVVEEYITGNEVTFPFVMQNGKLIINNTFLQLPVNLNGRPTFSLIIDNISHWIKFEDKYGDCVQKLMDRMGCHSGVGVLQTIYRDGKYYFLEFGYRLDGMAGWRLDKKRTGFDACAFLVDTQLGHSLDAWSTKVGNKKPPFLSATYLLYSHAGKVEKITGQEELKNKENVFISLSRFQEGSEVIPTGNMLQAAYMINFLSRDVKDQENHLRFINETVHHYDKNGQDMLCYFEDYSIFDNE